MKILNNEVITTFLPVDMCVGCVGRIMLELPKLGDHIHLNVHREVVVRHRLLRQNQTLGDYIANAWNTKYK